MQYIPEISFRSDPLLRKKKKEKKNKPPPTHTHTGFEPTTSRTLIKRLVRY